MKSWATMSGRRVTVNAGMIAATMMVVKLNHRMTFSPKRSEIAPPGTRSSTMNTAGAATMIPWSDSRNPRSIAYRGNSSVAAPIPNP